MNALLCRTRNQLTLATMLVAPMLFADVITTTYPPGPVATQNSYLPSNPPIPPSSVTSTSNAVALTLNAEALLLKEILKAHQNRAAEALQKNQSDKAKWENEWVNELQERIVRVQKDIEKTSHPGAQSSTSSSGEANPELVFVSTVEDRLAQIQRELSSAVMEVQVLSMQIATNQASETLGDISSALGNNKRLVNDLQKEQFDLELRKLEFRALQKAAQK